MNISKTKIMMFVNNSVLEQGRSFKYLGTNLDQKCTSKKEVRSRIEQTRAAFIKIKTFFSQREILTHLRLRMLKCYVFSVVRYGCECWTLDPTMEKRLEAFEMYTYRRTLEIPWTQNVTNKKVLQRINIIQPIPSKKENSRIFGHIIRG